MLTNNLIEDGYQENMITGTVFVDLSAAYDIINHRIYPEPAAKQNILRGINNEQSRWTLLNNNNF